MNEQSQETYPEILKAVSVVQNKFATTLNIQVYYKFQFPMNIICLQIGNNNMNEFVSYWIVKEDV